MAECWGNEYNTFSKSKSKFRSRSLNAFAIDIESRIRQEHRTVRRSRFLHACISFAERTDSPHFARSLASLTGEIFSPLRSGNPRRSGEDRPKLSRSSMSSSRSDAMAKEEDPMDIFPSKDSSPALPRFPDIQKIKQNAALDERTLPIALHSYSMEYKSGT